MPPHSQRSGLAWFFLILIPPFLVLAGLMAVFLWQGSKGGITPKWKSPTPRLTNAEPTGVTHAQPTTSHPPGGPP